MHDSASGISRCSWCGVPVQVSALCRIGTRMRILSAKEITSLTFQLQSTRVKFRGLSRQISLVAPCIWLSGAGGGGLNVELCSLVKWVSACDQTSAFTASQLHVDKSVYLVSDLLRCYPHGMRHRQSAVQMMGRSLDTICQKCDAFLPLMCVITSAC